MRIRRSVRSWASAWRQTKPILRGARLFILLAAVTTLGLSAFFMRGAVASPPCPCTVFTPSQPASAPALYNEPGGIELGFKMRFDHDGYISSIRFYKTPGMGGVHSASLWNYTGTVRMANATFVNESASGWQDVQFAPVAVTANATYTVSVFMADGNYTATGNYFTSQINDSPFIIQKNGEAWDGTGYSGQGVFNSSSTSAYPRNSFNATNYWIDATYISSPDATPPTITTRTPAANTTGVAVTDALTATFDKRLIPASVSNSTFLVTNDQGQPVPGAISYDPTTSTAKFVANALWDVGKTYTVTAKGGSSGIEDFEGHFMSADHSWSFTASTTPLNCPCSLQNNQVPTGSTTYREVYSNGLELGLKIVPNTNGYLTSLRFYKPLVNPDSSHTGHVWDAQGNLLATATTTGESDYGWQEATLTTPLSVTKDQLYIISFGLSTGDYQATFGKLATPLASPGFTAYPSNDPRNTALGSGTTNSVFMDTAGVYPSHPSNNNAYYYLDAVFSKRSQDSLPLSTVSAEPTDNSYAVSRSAPIRLTFDHALNPATITSTSVQLRDSANQLVTRSVSYDQARRAIVISPTSALQATTQYTASIDAGVTDVRGVALGHTYSWSFTTGASGIAIDTNQGAGGPVLVLTAPGDTYGKYYAEILRTEGIPYFTVKDTSQLSASLLSQYVTTIVAQTSLSQNQVDTLSSWVAGGGNLIAMRPDKKLSGLLGLTDTNTTSLNQYLRVDPTTAAGAGIVSQSMQYKGTADRYAPNGATTVARLYSDATTATTFPAVTTRTIGQGTASAFSYDLARSVIALHQGNQSWSGQDRNGDGVVRSGDLFYGPKPGDIQQDWLDPTKMAIPQADEQQRLLVNLMTDVMKHRLPAPRFWYLPNNQKAALVLAGDDHGEPDISGTRQVLNNLLNQSSSGCSETDWQCLRASHYVYVSAVLTNNQAAQFAGYGFEIGDHPSEQGQCNNYTSYASLYARYTTDLTTWRAKFTSLPLQATSRYHCYDWSDWDMMPRADQAVGVNYDLNTVAYPASWVNSNSPMVTGSGMNMRLADSSGALLNVHQGVTNFDNTAADTTAVTAMFDNALGATGYYGLFGSHYDMQPGQTYQQQLVDIAVSRGVPVISAAQALDWLTSREQSTITNLASPVSGKLTFQLTPSEGAHGLQTMLPLTDGTGQLISLSRDGQTVTYRTDTIKGVQYGIFDARAGNYEARYSDYSQPINQPGRGTSSSPSFTAPTSTPTSSRNQPTTPPNDVLTNRNAHGLTEDLTRRAASTAASTPWYRQPAVLMTSAGVAVAAAAGGGSWLAAVRRRNLK